MRWSLICTGLTGMALMTQTGCAAVLIGAGAAGGYAISRDSIRNTLDMSQAQVFQASREALGDVGFVSLEDASRGMLKATVEGANVTVTVKPVTERAVELKVRARNTFWFPRLETAQLVYNRILKHLGGPD